MQAGLEDELIWSARAFIYGYIADHARPPTVAEAASGLSLAVEQARVEFAALHARHALFLDADGASIRMANPFSGVPTDFRVFARGRAYWANCAWDMLGIPAALHADARIEARFADTGEQAVVTVEGDKVRGHGEVVYVRVPFSRWYDDLAYT
jgi:hypothetical protein